MPAASLTYGAPVLQVADLARSVAHYRDCLGFAVDFDHEGFYAGVARDGCHVHLRCSPHRRRDQQAFESAEQLDACFGVADAAALSAEFAAAGASITVPLRTMPYGREFYVRDPDGYILGFVEAAQASRS
ncbi:VOC family protein [Ramlibacter pallidus]|uniref:VOC family protein n=1 Tax=Ramlibacter pallidus TaxID=2780087 RepID=A0ABR9S3E7_9BURK|nr:VOC family protein [Ramlibacter pallidus]MBE7367998.1 VOC family protein [Ramlibacter pallidus]